jgi:hypothetical protein
MGLVTDVDVDLEVEEERRSEQAALRTKAVMDGWRRKWALPSLQAEEATIKSPKVFAIGSGNLRAANLRRSETTVIMASPYSTPDGVYKPPKSAPSKMAALSAPKPRMGKLVFESTKIASTAVKASKRVENVASCIHDPRTPAADPMNSEAEVQIAHRARAKLSQYRLVLS